MCLCDDPDVVGFILLCLQSDDVARLSSTIDVHAADSTLVGHSPRWLRYASKGRSLLCMCSELMTCAHPSAAAPFRCLTAMPPEGSTRARILPGCPSLDRRSRDAELAVLYCAENCIRWLVNAPNWSNPNRPDPTGCIPIRLAEDRDDFGALKHMAPLSTASCYFTSFEVNPQWWNPCTLLLWPHAICNCGLERNMITRIYERGVPPFYKEDIPPNDCRVMLRLCGQSIALLFELFMAVPEHCAFDIWTGKDGVPIRKRRFWPIPPVNWELTHQSDCDEYPYCLHHMLNELMGTRDEESLLAELSATWRWHRFSMVRLKDEEETGNHPERIWGPPTLKELCRVGIRRQLARSSSECVFIRC
ncbi:hypothetical protein T265_05595 [Opisthorchis viverrini]|uniref:SOCS box domain-containing protein n=1 Tax=Opisthorchis viverrini TaxID=6198 RepID=A0A074ZJ37_OPIVI|nr:hypothetical protein T265_05595 [Opisthorchis viverrini]KER27348.1 hypothetical protein T265_05595 [Opisthorchis viverrini]